ncbi:FadR/GntR family transcriptional regulator [Rhizobium sp. R693]|uniref:FadR/GntR family transcriptional regulator n=1 Tax=Rhizobium sp. R693 TaxID=1764276 RepID=UPI000B5323D9|nr:FadR/GntR family transcriptional regulator [Rhizobium sp. R693]OWV98889.1 GntR family transcriptional regulator [Rhizobium sp. R693]
MTEPATDSAIHDGMRLTTKVVEALRRQIRDGRYKPGDKLPSETKLTEEFGVSRTVIRESVASLRSDGLLESRQGAGVFVLAPTTKDMRSFKGVDAAKVSSLIEMLELRTGVETEASALAALRHSPAQEAEIIEALSEFSLHARRGEPTAASDFNFHLAIARAANNPRFVEFLEMVGVALIPRKAISGSFEQGLADADVERIIEEHEAILDAIQAGNEQNAQAAMQTHLRNSQMRYRAILRSSQGGAGGG